MPVRLIAHAKINLHLDVVGKMPDGFHAIRTVFQSVALGDEVCVQEREGRIRVVMVPRLNIRQQDNLAYQAARSLLHLRRADLDAGQPGLGSSSRRKTRGAEIEIRKRIPMGAGLGGGSADAAGALAGVGKLMGVPRGLLKQLAANLGADVPACLAGGTQFGFGRGDRLVRMTPAPATRVVLAVPEMGISTAWAYRELRSKAVKPDRIPADEESAERFESLIQNGQWKDLCYNAFEKPIFRKYPNLRSLKRGMLRHGAQAALMTGSGSGLFAIPEDVGAEKHLLGWLDQQPGLRIIKTRFVKRGIGFLKD